VPRGRRSFRRMRRGHRDLIWITTLIQASILEATVTDIADLVIPADWSTVAGFDRATLLGVRGWLATQPVAAGTATEASCMFGAMYVTDAGVAANSFNPSDANEYIDFDTIWTFGSTIGGSTTLGADQAYHEVEVKAKRKLTSAQRISIAAVVPTDTAAPRINFAGCVRCLLQLDPAG